MTEFAPNNRRELPRIPFVGSDEASPPASSSPGGAAEYSPGRKSGVVAKKENNSTLPKTVAGERSSQANGSATAAAVFHAFVKACQRLAEIHVHYEQQPEYPLTKVEKAGEKLDYRVTRMRLSKDKTSLIYNQFLSLSGAPPESHEYRLGNRSALEWVIDQYQVSTQKRSGITNDPNREDYPTCILRLIGQIVTVSLETASIVRSLPPPGHVRTRPRSLSARLISLRPCSQPREFHAAPAPVKPPQNISNSYSSNLIPSPFHSLRH